MNYYSEYVNNDKIEFLEYGILDKFEDSFYVNNKYIENNRGLLGDIVYIENDKVVGIKERLNHKIVGILDLESKVRFSTNNKSVVLFKPSNKLYPFFYVSYDNKNANKNVKVYALIDFKIWNINSKYPYGNLIEVIGNIDSLENTIEHLRYFYNIRNNSMNVDKLKKKKDIELLESIQEIIPDYYVFSIDPYGSKDIDDAFHFQKIDEYNYIIGVHIASPYKFFENDLLTILNRVSTVYSPLKKYNMLNNDYADNLLSLLENKNRFSLSIIFKIEYGLVSYTIKECIVKNIKNYDYDNFDKIYKKNNNLMEFFNYSKLFFNRSFDDEYDSHKLVEDWMIYSNKTVANYLIENNNNNLILRSHYSNTNKKVDFEHIDNIKLQNYLKNINENSAYYEIYDETKLQKHSKIYNDYYTHFTSPIRRAIDIFIHGLILKKCDLVNDKKVLENYLVKINNFTRNCRRFDRICRRLNFIYTIKNNDLTLITSGYIIKIDSYKLTLYISEYELVENFVLIHYKFKNISSVDYNENSIKFKIGDEDEKQYNLYDKLNLKLWVFTTFENIFDKLKVEII